MIIVRTLTYKGEDAAVRSWVGDSKPDGVYKGYRQEATLTIKTEKTLMAENTDLELTVVERSGQPSLVVEAGEFKLQTDLTPPAARRLAILLLLKVEELDTVAQAVTDPRYDPVGDGSEWE